MKKAVLYGYVAVCCGVIAYTFYMKHKKTQAEREAATAAAC